MALKFAVGLLIPSRTGARMSSLPTNGPRCAGTKSQSIARLSLSKAIGLFEGSRLRSSSTNSKIDCDTLDQHDAGSGEAETYFDLRRFRSGSSNKWRPVKT